MSLSKKELIRYSRHFNLPGFGVEGQERLKSGKVLVVGSGGLGAPLLQYLTAAGIGEIGIVDFDTVDESNLQRQVLFGTADIGLEKVEVAIEKLSQLNPNVKFVAHPVKLDSSNALDIISEYDVVADGTDNFPTPYLVNDACVLCQKPNVYASIFQYEGQVSVFNYLHPDGTRGPNYRDLFPDPPPPGMVPSCAEGGVLGVLPGIVGSLQANEVIKILTKNGISLSGKLLIVDALDMSFRQLNVLPTEDNPLTGKNPTMRKLIDYDEFCGMKNPGIKQVSVHELKAMMETNSPFQLIDVRESYEFEEDNLGGKHIPLRDILSQSDQISRGKKVILHCKSGERSAQAIGLLQDSLGLDNLCNLEGGIQEWNRHFSK